MQDEASSRRIECRLTTFLLSEMLEDYAEDVGVVERDRDLQMPSLVQSLVLGFTAGESHSLIDFRRSFNVRPTPVGEPLIRSGIERNRVRIGLLADIHANLPALEAVLDDMPSVDQHICAGDIVGYNPWPAECLELIQDTCSVVVQGNHDRKVPTPQEYAHNEMARAGLEHAKDSLTDSQQRWLANLPTRTEFADGSYRVAHSHPDPAKLGRYVRPAQFPKMRPYLDEHEGIVIAHTHIQHNASIDDRLIVNPGSVGQPRDKNPDAAYAVLDTETKTIDMRRVEYDINRVITRIEDIGLPVKTGTRLLEGS